MGLVRSAGVTEGGIALTPNSDANYFILNIITYMLLSVNVVINSLDCLNSWTKENIKYS